MTHEKPQIASTVASTPSRLGTMVINFLDRFLTDTLLQPDREDERHRARVIVVTSLASLAVAAVVVPVWTHDWPMYATSLIGAFTLVSVGVLIALKNGVSVALLGNAHSTFFYCGFMGLTYASGGTAIGAMASLITLPILAMVLSGAIAGIFWTAAILAGLALTAWSVPPIDAPPETYINEASLQFRFWSIGLMSMWMMGLGLTFRSLERVARREVDGARRAIAASDERYRSLAENAGDIVADFDHRLRCTFVSLNCFEILGFSPQQLIDAVPSEHFDPAQFETLLEAMKRSQADIMPQQVSVRFRHSKGHWVSVEASVNSYHDRAGMLRSVAVVRDVSELRRAEAAVRHSERLASTGTLAAGMAHQVNNPVGAILNSSEFALLALQDGDLKQVREALECNVEQARRCGRIVHGLLQFSRSQPMSKQPQDLGELVARAVELTASYGSERRLDVDFVAHLETLMVEVNVIEIEQVLVNLLRNAMEASSPGDRIEVRLTAEGADAFVEIEDHGRGVAESDRAHVFDPFFTTRMHEGGSGLGLSVAHGIIAEHEGRMDFVSQSGLGTMVSFSLPLAAPA